VSNDHLFSLGATEINRREFQLYLDQYLDEIGQTHWQFDLPADQME